MTTASALRPYPRYKPSGIPWLGDVPEHWETGRLKRYATNVVSLVSAREPDEVYIALENVESWTGRIRSARSDVTFDSQVKRFEADDVLFGKLRPYLAKVTRPRRNGVCVGEFLVLRPRPGTVAPAFLEQLLRSKPIIDAVQASTFGAKMPRADWQYVGGMELTWPPLPDQAAIVRYLDHVDRRIQKYIRAKQKLIALLNEQKQAIIHRAVTGQIDVRTGKPYPKYKPSGVPWLGDVPEHWEVRRLKNAARLIMGQSPSSTDCGPDPIGQPFLQGCAEFGVDHPKPKQFCGNPPKTAPAGAILVSVRAPVGRLNVADQSYGIGRGLCALLPDARFYESDYARFLLSASVHGLTVVSTGSTYDAVSVGDVGNLPTLLPPLPDQAAIVRYLEEATASVTAAIHAAWRGVDLLREYRTRLVADVVTGKLDVREAAANLPEDEEEFEEAEVEDEEAAEELAEEASDSVGEESDA